MNFKKESELLERAKSLKGRRISELFSGAINEKNKGNIGNLIESAGFGIKNNSEARPDFDALGIELKVLPMKRLGNRSLTVKERTKICLINYKKLIHEKWPDSHAREKLDRILFIFYEYHHSSPLESIILDYLLFKLELNDEPLIKSDWERTRQLVENGHAHTLSESQNIILAASRSGAGKLPEHEWPEQPNQTYSKRARQRSFSLKPSFTKTLWTGLQTQGDFDRIMDIEGYQNYDELEKIILSRLSKWEGGSLLDFSKTHSIVPGKGKNYESVILRRALGFHDKEKPIKEILQLGLTVKTIPARKSDLYPYEAMSFPYQPLAELAAEDRFDESDFYSYLQGFLFIPLLRERRENKAPEDVFFGKSLIWKPTHDELLLIQKDWELIRDIVRAGVRVEKKEVNSKRGFIMSNNLPGESDTRCIHMRPHARDADDIDPTINVKISKQSFWFNKKFIQKLLIAKYESM